MTYDISSIEKIRTQRKLKIVDILANTGVSKDSYRRWRKKQGEPNYSQMVRIAINIDINIIWAVQI